MEKNIYETPLTQIVEIETEGILCGSGGGTNLTGSGIEGYDEFVW